jgi:hypothetical protein
MVVKGCVQLDYSVFLFSLSSQQLYERPGGETCLCTGTVFWECALLGAADQKALHKQQELYVSALCQ